MDSILIIGPYIKCKITNKSKNFLEDYSENNCNNYCVKKMFLYEEGKFNYYFPDNISICINDIQRKGSFVKNMSLNSEISIKRFEKKFKVQIKELINTFGPENVKIEYGIHFDVF